MTLEERDLEIANIKNQGVKDKNSKEQDNKLYEEIILSKKGINAQLFAKIRTICR